MAKPKPQTGGTWDKGAWGYAPGKFPPDPKPATLNKPEPKKK